MTSRTSVHAHRLALRGIVAAALGVVLLGFSATASAQSIGRMTVDFAFVAGKTECAPGTYDIDTTGGRIGLRSKDVKGAQVQLLPITRLGRHDKDTDTEIIFDKVGDKLILAEIWLGGQDGYLLVSTPGAHEHRVIGGPAARK